MNFLGRWRFRTSYCRSPYTWPNLLASTPSPLHGVLHQQRFLVLDAFGLILSFVLILLAQPCINRAKNRPHLLTAQLLNGIVAREPSRRKFFRIHRKKYLHRKTIQALSGAFFYQPVCDNLLYHRTSCIFIIWFSLFSQDKDWFFYKTTPLTKTYEFVQTDMKE